MYLNSKAEQGADWVGGVPAVFCLINTFINGAAFFIFNNRLSVKVGWYMLSTFYCFVFVKSFCYKTLLCVVLPIVIA
jgi:hypothetical protein